MIVMIVKHKKNRPKAVSVVVRFGS